MSDQARLERFYIFASKRPSVRFQCPDCGVMTARLTDICRHCGADLRLRAKLRSWRYQCSRCGAMVGADSVACEHCGADIR